MPQRQSVAERLSQRTGRQRRNLRGLHLLLDDVEQWPGPLLAQSMARCMIQARIASFGINQKQLVGPSHELPRDAVVGIEFEGVEHLPAGMRPTGRMHHLRTARSVVCDVAIGLQNTFKLAEESFRTFAPASHPEFKDCTFSGFSVLPQIDLMI